jgi:hypothetical protein
LQFFTGGGATPATVPVFKIHLVLCPHQINSNFMALQVITSDDLQKFKQEILLEIQANFQKYEAASRNRWLKSMEVRKLLRVSSGTLQTLRLNGTLKFAKLGGIIYYDQAHVHQLLLNSLSEPGKIRNNAVESRK